MTRFTCVRSLVSFALLLFSFFSFFSLFSFAQNTPAKDAYAKLPLAFEQNQGQADARAAYIARGSGYSLFLTRDSSVLRLGAKRGTVLRTDLLGAQQAQVNGEAELPGKANYLIDKDPKNWVTNVPLFERVRYAGVYPGVDLLYYGKQGRLEYDFVVAPGADARQIKMRIAGAEKLTVTKDGALEMVSGGRKLRWAAPVAYQSADRSLQSSVRKVTANYAVRGSEISFVVGPYDRSRQLVIDPVLVYSTYLGGSVDADPFNGTGQPGSATNEATGVAVDAGGNAYVAGTTNANDFPVTSGAYDTTGSSNQCSPHGPCQSGFITKINPSGTALVYSTYFGQPEVLTALAIDGTGRAYVTGWVVPGFSGVPTTANAFQTTMPCDQCESAGFVSVLSANGASLVYSSLFAETQPFTTSIKALAIAVGTSGVAYITGYVDGPDMPLKNAYQTTMNGNEDAFVAKLDPAKSGAASLEYATYLGGSEQDHGEGIATASGMAYVSGFTASTNFPTTAGAMKRTLGGATDGIVAKIDTNQLGVASLVWSTQLGGAGIDDAKAIAVVSGAPYVTGFTQSTDFPVTSGATQKTHTTCGSDGNVCDDVFVTKLNTSGSGVVYSTYLGGSLQDDASAITVDGSGNALVTGFTGSSDFPTTTDALSRTLGNSACSGSVQVCGDAFLAKISPTGSRLFSTYFGGAGGDVGTGVARDSSGNAYLTGYTESSNLPTTSGAFSRTRTGMIDAFLAKVSFGASGGTGCSTTGAARSVVICQPANGSTVQSPVHITAAVHHGSSAIKVVQVYVDGVKKFETGPSGLGNADNGDNILNTDIAMANGAHRVTVQAVDASGAFKSTVNMNVGPTTEACSTSGVARTVTICQPINGSTVSSPVHVSAAAHPGSTTTTVLQLYVDGVKKQEANAGGLGHTDSGDIVWQTDQAMAVGTHRVTVQAIDSSGAYKATVNITVK
jgi:hypothetical protein